MGIFRNLFYIAKEIISRAVVKIKNIFFEKALSMLKTVMNKLVSKVKGILLGSAHFYRMVNGIYQEGTKNYSLEEELGEWNETTVVKQIMLEELPEKYRVLSDEFEIDDTKELNENLIY